MNHITPRPLASYAENENIIVEQTFTGQMSSRVQEGVVYMNCVFRDTRWIGVSLHHVRFINCHFDHMFCAGMHATDVQWDTCVIRDLEWHEVDIQQSQIMNSEVTKWHMDFSQFMHVGLTKAKVSSWHLTDCQLQHLTWMDCDVQQFTQVASRASDMSWIDSKITDARVERCNLERFITAQSTLIRFSLIACKGSQVRATQSNLAHATYRRNDMGGSSWSHSELNDCQFANCTLPLAGFDSATLNRVCFDRVEMPRAMFDRASAKVVQFKNVQAPNASFRNVRFFDVAFNQATLSELDGRGLHADFMTLRDVDCRRANLIGQEPQAWHGAQLQGALFEEPKELNDRTWWLETSPGHRVALS